MEDRVQQTSDTDAGGTGTSPVLAPPSSDLDPPSRLAALRAPLGIAVGAAGTAGAVAAFSLPHPPLPACPSLTLFGVLCPLCGGTRGTWALLSGDIGAAASYNLLVPVLAVFVLWGYAAWSARRAGWRVPRVRRQGMIWGVMAVVAFVYAVLRNLPVEPFTVLAP